MICTDCISDAYVIVEYESVYTPEAFAATTPTLTGTDRMSEGPSGLRSKMTPLWVPSPSFQERVAVHRGMASFPRRGQSIGTLLLEQVEDFASKRSYARLSEHDPFLTRAIRFMSVVGPAERLRVH